MTEDSRLPQLAYEESGNPAGPAILLIHGFLSSNLQWALNRQTLAERFRLVMVEIWGHGDSTAPEADEAYTPAAYVEVLDRLRESLKIRRWWVIGQSYGAGIVLNYAMVRPEKVIGVVFTNSRSALGADAQGYASRTIPSEESLVDLRRLPMHPAHATGLPGDLRDAMISAADSVSPVAAYRIAKMSYTLNCRERMGELTVPVLLINGIYEPLFQPEVTFIRDTYPAIQVVDLPAGHSANLDDPKGFNEAVLAFCGT